VGSAARVRYAQCVSSMVSRLASECATLRTGDDTDSPYISNRASGEAECKEVHVDPLFF
jgi:hypothetical protein